MLSSYCLKCRKNTESKNPKVVLTKNRRIMLLSECAVCNSEKSRFIKGQEARRLLNSLELRVPLTEVSLWGPLLVLKV